MSSSIHPEVTIQTSSQSIPTWFGEVAVIAHTLRRLNVLATIEERVRFARRRFGHYDVIDFVVVLLGYAISGERTLEAFYERVHPFAIPFMAQIAARASSPPLNAFSPRWVKHRSKRCALRFSKTWSLALWKRRKKREGCGTGKEHSGSCSMSMALDKLLANAPYHAHPISRQHSND